ncbi:anti-sigma factor, partial [Nakamurella sp.]|uniref:anti-sigma factor n=1 Tax=Nakamurella sp. TaxID=1869182 RepID=UPI003B3A7DD4
EPGAPATDPGAGPAGVSSTGRPDNVRPLRPWFRRPAAWLAAAAAAVVLGGGLVAIDRTRGPEQVAQTPEQCVATAADRTTLTPANGQGAVDYAPSCAAVTVDVSGLPALPDGRTYQLWALSGEPSTAPRSLGLLPAAATGAAQTVTQPTRPGEVAVAVTAEPAGGSVAPTLPIVWSAELTS